MQMQKKINSWLITQIDKGTQTDYLELDSSEFLSNEIRADGIKVIIVPNKQAPIVIVIG